MRITPPGDKCKLSPEKDKNVQTTPFELQSLVTEHDAEVRVKEGYCML